jgi:hypothetical protein
MIYWALDSSCFVLPEEETGRGLRGQPQHYLRLFDVQTGRSWIAASGNPNTAILWDGESRSFFFSGTSTGADGSDSMIYRVDRRTGTTVPLLSQGDNFLLSWNQGESALFSIKRFALRAPKARERLPHADSFPARAMERMYGNWAHGSRVTA